MHYVAEEEESEEEPKNKTCYSFEEGGGNFEKKMTNVVSAPKNMYFIFECHTPS
jgi:hypothetical protein